MNARSTVLLWVRESVTDPLSADVNFSPAFDESGCGLAITETRHPAQRIAAVVRVASEKDAGWSGQRSREVVTSSASSRIDSALARFLRRGPFSSPRGTRRIARALSLVDQLFHPVHDTSLERSRRKLSAWRTSRGRPMGRGCRGSDGFSLIVESRRQNTGNCVDTVSGRSQLERGLSESATSATSAFHSHVAGRRALANCTRVVCKRQNFILSGQVENLSHDVHSRLCCQSKCQVPGCAINRTFPPARRQHSCRYSAADSTLSTIRRTSSSSHGRSSAPSGGRGIPTSIPYRSRIAQRRKLQID